MKSNKRKFFTLIGGLFLILFLAYKLSFKKAIAEYQRHTALQQVEEQSWQVQKDLELLQVKSQTLDNQLGSSKAWGFEENLLNAVGLFSEENGLDVDLFSEPAIGTQNGYRVETIIVKVRGDFKTLLSLLHYMEKTFRSGRIASVSFEKQMDYKRNREELYIKMFVQNIKPLDNDA